ncbi:MAG: hypothetical protein ACI9OJ_002446 [Myxococcota bacterium]|jgi:hypothetical protein
MRTDGYSALFARTGQASGAAEVVNSTRRDVATMLGGELTAPLGVGRTTGHPQPNRLLWSVGDHHEGEPRKRQERLRPEDVPSISAAELAAEMKGVPTIRYEESVSTDG